MRKYGILVSAFLLVMVQGNVSAQPVLFATTGSGQGFPIKTMRLVTNEAGAGSDVATRLIAQGLAASLGQAAIVENRGGSSLIPTQIVMNAPPDGHTLYSATTNLWILPLLQTVPYDTLRDFSPITLAVSSPNVIAVHPSVSVHSVKELIALAKAKPGELSYGSGSAGASTQLAAELFKHMAGVNILHVPSRGAAPALNAVVAGQVQLIVISARSVMPFSKSGGLRALAVASAQPSALAPGLPTAAAAGLPGYESGLVNGILAPARTPLAVVDRLNAEIVRNLQSPDVKDKLFNASLEVVGSSPREFTAKIKSEIALWGKVIKDAGIRQQ